MFLTSVVPAAVPSLFHSSRPLVPSSALKIELAVEAGEDCEGKLPSTPGRMSFTITVPAAVPSLFHSSRPLAPSSAVKNRVPSTSANVLYSGAASVEPTLPG